jgi:hypothetical protein
MNERNDSETETLRNTRTCKFRTPWLYLLAAFVFMCVVIVFCVYIVLAIRQQKAVVFAPHEIAIKNTTGFLMNRIEYAFSFYADWTATNEKFSKEKVIEASKRINNRIETLNRKLGPIETRENETFDEATRIVIPILSGKFRDLSTGKVGVVRDFVEYVLEKRKTSEGQQWRIISDLDPNYAEIESTWLKLPRKKVPHSPTIIVKRAVVLQIVSDDGKVVGERTILCDE